MTLNEILNIRYDEFKYLDNQKEILEKLSKQRNTLLKIKEYNERHYKVIIEIYNQILEDLSLLLKNNIDDDLLIYCGALSAIVWNGYVSNLRKFRYYEEETMDLEGYLGIDVLSGFGCCRHISYLFKDFLDKNNFNTEYILTREYDIKSDFSSLGFDRYSKFGKMPKCGFNGYINSETDDFDHACIIFYAKNNYFIYDPTNIQIYKMNGTKGKIGYGIGKIEMFPFSLIYYSDFDIEALEQYINNLQKSKSSYNIDILWNKMVIGSNFVMENRKLFDEFYNDKKYYLNTIDEEKKLILQNRE